MINSFNLDEIHPFSNSLKKYGRSHYVYYYKGNNKRFDILCIDISNFGLSIKIHNESFVTFKPFSKCRWDLSYLQKNPTDTIESNIFNNIVTLLNLLLFTCFRITLFELIIQLLKDKNFYRKTMGTFNNKFSSDYELLIKEKSGISDEIWNYIIYSLNLNLCNSRKLYELKKKSMNETAKKYDVVRYFDPQNTNNKIIASRNLHNLISDMINTHYIEISYHEHLNKTLKENLRKFLDGKPLEHILKFALDKGSERKSKKDISILTWSFLDSPIYFSQDPESNIPVLMTLSSEGEIARLPFKQCKYFSINFYFSFPFIVVF